MIPTDLDARIANAMKSIFESIPARLNITAIVRDAHAQLTEAAGPDAPQQVIADKLIEVLREIATYAVDQFTGRTGQPFLWVDEPELPEDPEPLMTFGVDDKGNVTF